MDFSEFLYFTPRLDRAPDGERSRLSRLYKAGHVVRIQPSVYLDTDQWLGLSFADRRRSFIGAFGLTGKRSVLVGLSALSLYGVPLIQFGSPVSNLVNVGVNSVNAVRKRKQVSCYGNEQDAIARYNKRSTSNGSHVLPKPPLIRGQLLTPNAPRSLTFGSWEFPLLAEPLDIALTRSFHELSFEDRVVAFEYLLRRGQAHGHHWTHQKLEELALSLPDNRRRSRIQITAKFSRTESESVGESMSRALMYRLGFEEPELQQSFQLPNGRIARPDYLWRNAQIVGEFDGAQKYTRSKTISGKDAGQVVYEEKQREDSIRSMGLGMCRWGWNELMNPSTFASILVAAGVPRPFPRGRNV